MSSMSSIPVTESVNELFHANGNGSEKSNSPSLSSILSPAYSLKAGLAQMLKGGVIMDVTNAEEARIAEECGAVAVMALERVPSDIRKDGGVARMSHPKMIREIQQAVTIPVMAKARIGHFVEAQILEALKVDYIDESEVLTPADEVYHINKHDFSVPFVCGCRNLGEALRRIQEGAAFIRTKGEAGTGNIVEAVRHARAVNSEIRKLQTMDKDELYHSSKELGASYELLKLTARLGRLPVVQFAAGGIATPGPTSTKRLAAFAYFIFPLLTLVLLVFSSLALSCVGVVLLADAALMMQLGMDGVFVGSGIFKSADPKAMGTAIVQATTHYRDAKILAQVSAEVGESMKGLEITPGKITLFANRSS